MTNIKLSGYVRDLTGSALDTAVVERFDRNDTTTVLETATLSGGKWTFDVTPQNDNTDRFDVRATVGTEQTFLHYDDEVQLTTLETANFRIRTPTGAQANKWVYDIVGAVITADRTLKLPLITTTDTLATLGLAATFSAIMTHSADIILQDDVDLALGTSSDALMRWSDGDADNHALVLALGNTSQQFHITDVGAVATDWARSAGTHPELAIHSNTTPATDYLALGNHDGTTADINVVGGTTLTMSVDGTAQATVTAAVLNIPSGNTYQINGTDVLSATTLGTGVTASSLTSLGTITSDIQLDADLDFIGAQSITTSAGNLTLAAASGADVLIGDATTTLYIDGAANTIGFGAAPNSVNYFDLQPTFTGNNIVSLRGTLTGNSGQNLTALSFSPTFVENGDAGTHTLITTVSVGAATVTGGTHAVTDTASLYVAGAMSATVTGENYSFWVDTGSSRLDNSLFVESSPTEGSSGEQLTSGGAGAVMTWAAAGSLERFKHTIGDVSPQEALRKVNSWHPRRFTYREDADVSTHDYATEYVGVYGEEAPEVMHHEGRIFSPVSAFGYAVLAIQGLQQEIRELKGAHDG